MAQPRSLQLSSAGKTQVEQAMTDKAWRLEDLIKASQLSEATVKKFRAGKGIDRTNFVTCCQALGLDWKTVADLPREPASSELMPMENPSGHSVHPATAPPINRLVQETRQTHQSTIKNQCGTVWLLGARKSVDIGRLFVRVNILEHLTAEQRWEMVRLLDYFNQRSQAFDRFGLSNRVETIAGNEAVTEFKRLMVLGKPGSGKTTFLKHIAMACSVEGFLPDYIPVFLSLKKFADDLATHPDLKLFEALRENLSACNLNPTDLVTLLRQGRILLLLDGLDEAGDTQEVVDRRVRQFIDEFHPNRFVISCRIAAYSSYFEGFTDVEVADFDRQQVQEFVQKWFASVVRSPNPEQAGQAWAEKFMTALDHSPQIRDLTVNPLLLNLACVVFRDNERFPDQKHGLYEESLTTLLSTWDDQRQVQRDSRYKALSIGERLRLLSQIGMQTFAEEAYFFQQERLETLIGEFLQTLPSPPESEKTLLWSSAGVLKAIEAHHGLLVERARRIYSFSHLTFQEYFTARHLIASRSGLEQSASHAADPRWQEVFSLATAMLGDASFLIRVIKRAIDQAIANVPNLQAFLRWVQQKSDSVCTDHNPAAVRAFYFALALALTLNRTLDRALDLVLDLDLARALDSTLALARTSALNLDLDLARALNRTRAFERTIAKAGESDPELKLKLEYLYRQLPNSEDELEVCQQWWQANGQDWAEALRRVMIEHLNIGHDWQFTESQKRVLQRYHDANKFLVELLKVPGAVSDGVRREIEETLLLPIAELQRRLPERYGDIPQTSEV